MGPKLVQVLLKVVSLLSLVAFFQGCRAVSSDLSPTPSPQPTAAPIAPLGPSEDAVDFG